MDFNKARDRGARKGRIEEDRLGGYFPVPVIRTRRRGICGAL